MMESRVDPGNVSRPGSSSSMVIIKVFYLLAHV